MPADNQDEQRENYRAQQPRHVSREGHPGVPPLEESLHGLGLAPYGNVEEIGHGQQGIDRAGRQCPAAKSVPHGIRMPSPRQTLAVYRQLFLRSSRSRSISTNHSCKEALRYTYRYSPPPRMGDNWHPSLLLQKSEAGYRRAQSGPTPRGGPSRARIAARGRFSGSCAQAVPPPLARSGGDPLRTPRKP